MSLALATLIYEWRRYLAAVIALAFCGMMVMAFSGMFAGIIHTEFHTWEHSSADLIILPANVKSLVNSNASLPARVKPLIYMNPEVVDVEELGGDGAQFVNTPKPGGKQVQRFVQIFSIDTTPGSVTIPTDLSEQAREALMEPGAIAIDASNLAPLGVQLGDKAEMNGHTVWIRAVLHGYQSPEQPVVITSRETVRLMGMDQEGLRIGPLMVKLRDPKRAEIVRDQLNALARGAYSAQTMKQFNQANEQAVMGQQIIGLLLGFSIFLAVLIGIGVTSQTLRGAILSNIREFASLRALGISMGSLRLIVMELSFWVGIAGLGAALLLTVVIATLGRAIGLPIALRLPIMGQVCVMLLVLAVASGAMAMGILKKSQPADLLPMSHALQPHGLVAEGLTKRFRTGRTHVTVLANVDFEARPGEVTMVMGPSGSGKSTLIAALSGLLRPDEGKVSALGADLWSRKASRIDRFRLDHCGFIFQGFNLFPALTAYEQVATVLRYKGMSRKAARTRAIEALTEVGLERRMRQRPSELSGGEKQRVAIARALAKQPNLVFADEPTSALDGESGQVVVRMLRRAATEHGAAVICVTHDPRLEAFADRLVRLEDGRVLSDEPLIRAKPTPVLEPVPS